MCGKSPNGATMPYSPLQSQQGNTSKMIAIRANNNNSNVGNSMGGIKLPKPSTISRPTTTSTSSTTEEGKPQKNRAKIIEKSYDDAGASGASGGLNNKEIVHSKYELAARSFERNNEQELNDRQNPKTHMAQKGQKHEPDAPLLSRLAEMAQAESKSMQEEIKLGVISLGCSDPEALGITSSTYNIPQLSENESKIDVDNNEDSTGKSSKFTNVILSTTNDNGTASNGPQQPSNQLNQGNIHSKALKPKLKSKLKPCKKNKRVNPNSPQSALSPLTAASTKSGPSAPQSVQAPAWPNHGASPLMHQTHATHPTHPYYRHTGYAVVGSHTQPNYLHHAHHHPAREAVHSHQRPTAQHAEAASQSLSQAHPQAHRRPASHSLHPPHPLSPMPQTTQTSYSSMRELPMHSRAPCPAHSHGASRPASHHASHHYYSHHRSSSAALRGHHQQHAYHHPYEYGDHAEYADYGECTDYPDYADYANYGDYSDYAGHQYNYYNYDRYNVPRHPPSHLSQASQVSQVSHPSQASQTPQAISVDASAKKGGKTLPLKKARKKRKVLEVVEKVKAVEVVDAVEAALPLSLKKRVSEVFENVSEASEEAENETVNETAENAADKAAEKATEKATKATKEHATKGSKKAAVEGIYEGTEKAKKALSTNNDGAETCLGNDGSIGGNDGIGSDVRTGGIGGICSISNLTIVAPGKNANGDENHTSKDRSKGGDDAVGAPKDSLLHPEKHQDNKDSRDGLDGLSPPSDDVSKKVLYGANNGQNADSAYDEDDPEPPAPAPQALPDVSAPPAPLAVPAPPAVAANEANARCCHENNLEVVTPSPRGTGHDSKKIVEAPARFKDSEPANDVTFATSTNHKNHTNATTTNITTCATTTTITPVMSSDSVVSSTNSNNECTSTLGKTSTDATNAINSDVSAALHLPPPRNHNAQAHAQAHGHAAAHVPYLPFHSSQTYHHAHAHAQAQPCPAPHPARPAPPQASFSSHATHVRHPHQSMHHHQPSRQPMYPHQPARLHQHRHHLRLYRTRPSCAGQQSHPPYPPPRSTHRLNTPHRHYHTNGYKRHPHVAGALYWHYHHSHHSHPPHLSASPPGAQGAHCAHNPCAVVPGPAVPPAALSLVSTGPTLSALSAGPAPPLISQEAQQVASQGHGNNPPQLDVEEEVSVVSTGAVAVKFNGEVSAVSVEYAQSAHSDDTVMAELNASHPSHQLQSLPQDSRGRCVHIWGSMLMNFIGKKNDPKNRGRIKEVITVPSFHQLVNFPQFLPQKSPSNVPSNGHMIDQVEATVPSDSVTSSANSANSSSCSPRSAQCSAQSPCLAQSCNSALLKNCVMCGTSCLYAGSNPVRSPARSGGSVKDEKDVNNVSGSSPITSPSSIRSSSQLPKPPRADPPLSTSLSTRSTSPLPNTHSTQLPPNSLYIIPRQNKGLCTSCDVKVWLVRDMNLAIKWCKGCKNFREWSAFGQKTRATKCEKCRERQKEKYALQKKTRAVNSNGTNNTNSANNSNNKTCKENKGQKDQKDFRQKKEAMAMMESSSDSDEHSGSSGDAYIAEIPKIKRESQELEQFERKFDGSNQSFVLSSDPDHSTLLDAALGLSQMMNR